jgi:predicted PurR-regulated permease PerM
VRDAPFLNLVLATAMVLMVGWLLVIGRPILLPVVTAVISVYVLTTAAEALGRVPVIGRLPPFSRHLLVLLGFTLTLVGLALVVSVTLGELVRVMPAYQENLEALIGRVADTLNVDTHPTWDQIKRLSIDQMNLQALLLRVLGGITSLGFAVFLVIVYAGFLMGERGMFAAKLNAALPRRDQAEQTERIIAEINRKIGDYLAVKTLVNIILGVISYAILWAMGVDFALFWAVVIALTNYIPYVGSIVGVALPVVLSLAQFGSLGTTAVLGTLLIGAQTYVGNVLEPRLIGRQLNLSPFIVLLALAVWSSIWGLPGAILAIPMTSVITIILGSFASTRFVAVLLAESVDPPSAEPASSAPSTRER